jgi:alkanesulfonate monooxygenase
MKDGIDLYTTCPPYKGQDAGQYLEQVSEVSRWSDDAGCKGILVYTDNSLPDPWLIAQLVIQHTHTLEPLVAVQPVYMHPYSVAKMVSTLSVMYNRRMCLNMVAGGFTNDLRALSDTTPHDRRYDRLVEYGTIIQRLLEGNAPVTVEGEFYRVEQLTLKPVLPRQLYPVITISGSSAAGLSAAAALKAVAVKYPEPPEQVAAQAHFGSAGCGCRIGIIARESEEDAWRIAEERFPSDRMGMMAHRLAMKTSDSVWHRTLSGEQSQIKEKRSTYWLGPFENYKTFCPYLVGSYESVSDCLAVYLAEGFTTIILDVPASEQDLTHTRVVLAHARQKVEFYELASKHSA